ncbi:MAG: nuclear transport factor 2 family protein [Flavobacterium sp.]|nr:MAG: nuclear transport factor 2 family protein [Flavobacterium sp.]
MAESENQFEEVIRKAYNAFNERNIDNALATMQPDVQWSKAWEGGYIVGHDEIKKYWTRQWTEINPKVEPIGFNARENGSLEVTVHQVVKDLLGNLMFDGLVKHVYTFQNGLIKTMDIELVEE